MVVENLRKLCKSSGLSVLKYRKASGVRRSEKAHFKKMGSPFKKST